MVVRDGFRVFLLGWVDKEWFVVVVDLLEPPSVCVILMPASCMSPVCGGIEHVRRQGGPHETRRGTTDYLATISSLTNPIPFPPGSFSRCLTVTKPGLGIVVPPYQGGKA